LQNPLLDIDYTGATGALIQVCGGPDMTLEEINRVGELVTEGISEEANVIWGARVSEEFKGKLTVMTIITGVHSPWIVGKQVKKLSASAAVMKEVTDDLGIEIIH